MRELEIGLTSTEVEQSRQKYGDNILSPTSRTPWWHELLKKFRDPLIVILLVAGLLSIGIAFYEHLALKYDWKVFFEPVGIFVAIGLATGLAFIFEHKANAAFRILNLVNDNEPVEVIRNGSATSIARRDVVVGDIVILNTGCEVPADGELLDCVTLSVDESSLTGEPVCFKTTEPSQFDNDATYSSNKLYRGTKVMEGHGVMRVLNVGDATEQGKVFKEAQIESSIKTPLDKQLQRLSVLITYASYTVAGLVIVAQIINYLGWENWAAYLPTLPIAGFFYLVMKHFDKLKPKMRISLIISFFAFFVITVAVSFLLISTDAGSTEWSKLWSHTLQTLMVAVTLIVVSVPEGLPMAVTLSLACSMRSMFKTNNLVRKLHACETMGATTIICTDKTGTLTQNRMQVAEFEINKYVKSEIVYEGIAVNTTATLDFSGSEPIPLGNPTEGALLLWLNSQHIDYRKLKHSAHRISEIPFSTERKFMASIVRSSVTGSLIIYIKGAPEIILGLCKRGNNDVDCEYYNNRLIEYQNNAMRTLGFAYSQLPELPESEIETIVETLKSLDGNPLPEFSLIGMAAISDPVRKDVPNAVKECMDAGIEVKIVTGDTSATAREIGRRIGLWSEDDSDINIITGPEFAALTDEELMQRVNDLKIISRARPIDKKRLVESLQAKGHVVAVTGDGTNDAPALKQAHVGLSMGTGTAVAKEASDITIIDNSFSSIGRAVMWGRSLYKNIQRFLLFQLTVNVAACLLVLCGSFVGSESPLTVTQMLWVNLIMDTFGAMALASLPPSEASND